jgi:predicted enzyme related to lactoylglutathione lyase
MRGAATIYVTHLETMAAFYVTCLDLKLVDGVAGEYRILESDGWTLSVVQVPPAVAAAITLTAPPARRDATPLKLTFDVLSIAAARSAMARLGGRADAIEQAWEFRGFRHCDFVDPEGNVLQVRERILKAGGSVGDS